MSTRPVPTAPESSGLAALPAAAENDITILLPKREPVAARTYGVRTGLGVPTDRPLVLHLHGGNFANGDLDDG
ncbi:MAG: alpha/beta hydrolase, partial [Variovorax sp.]